MHSPSRVCTPYVCLSVHGTVCLVSQSMALYVLSVSPWHCMSCQSVHGTVCLSVSPQHCKSVSQSMAPSVSPRHCKSVSQSMALYVCQSVRATGSQGGLVGLVTCGTYRKSRNLEALMYFTRCVSGEIHCIWRLLVSKQDRGPQSQGLDCVCVVYYMCNAAHWFTC